MVTGIDLVKEQIQIAAGRPLGLPQEAVKLTGHAIECRINAETPEDQFRPCPGRIEQWEQPTGPGIRIDTHCFSGYFVPPFYDSLLAKLVIKGGSRHEAVDRMKEALAKFVVSGIHTTIPFYQFMLKHSDYLSGKLNTRWVEDVLLKEYAQPCKS